MTEQVLERNCTSHAMPVASRALVRNDWTKDEIAHIFRQPLLDLIFQAAETHRLFHDSGKVQKCTLLSIKTGACPEDCAYCPQSARYKTAVEAEPLMQTEQVLAAAREAKDSGSTRFCMGAAWREVKDNEQFDRVLNMVKGVSEMGLEVCCTLGMLSPDQARKLKEAGLTAYNHNLDTGENFYSEIITTRTYQDRLDTLKNVRDAGLSVCCGGIVGMGETDEDRIDMLHTLATLPKHPESVPVNALVSVSGTPLESQPRVPFWTLLRMVATARIVMPLAMVRLSAGRKELSHAEQALCFLSGANSIFAGEKLLTTPNCESDEDAELFSMLSLEPLEPSPSCCN